jgi:hypothetical protein
MERPQKITFGELRESGGARRPDLLRRLHLQSFYRGENRSMAGPCSPVRSRALFRLQGLRAAWRRHQIQFRLERAAVSTATAAPYELGVSVPWSTSFDDPIELPDGKTLRTLSDAIKYLGKSVPKAERDHSAVVPAATILTRAAEGRDFLMHARIATLQAIRRHDERVFNPDRKETHWGKRKLKRDE